MSNIEIASVNSAGLTTATTAYSANDVVGTGWQFANAGGGNPLGGRILGARLLDKADIISAVDLYVATASITFGTDNAAVSVSDTDAAKIIASITMVAADLGGCRVATAGTFMVPYVPDAADLFIYGVTRSAHTFFGAATDLVLTLLYERDS